MGGVPVAIDARRQPAVMRQIRTLFGAGTASGLSDGELLGRFAARAGESSELAFAALLERHGRMVWGICRRVLDDPRDVEDAFQATFLVLVRRARSIRNRDSVASWLHGVAYRVACSARSADLRRRRHERFYSEQAERLAPPPRDESLDLKPIVDGELLRLPERYRAVVVLCDMEGLSYEQAARSLGWPMGTVKSRLARGREKLRSRLIRRGVAPLAGLIGAEVPAELLRSTAQAASRVAARPIVAGGVLGQRRQSHGRSDQDHVAQQVEAFRRGAGDRRGPRFLDRARSTGPGVAWAKARKQHGAASPRQAAEAKKRRCRRPS